MKFKFSALFLFIFSTLLFLFPLKNALAASYSLSGTVKDNAGNAIGNAIVHIYTVGTTTDVVPSTTTDTNSGVYNFSSLSEGTYDIQITPPSEVVLLPIVGSTVYKTTHT